MTRLRIEAKMFKFFTRIWKLLRKKPCNLGFTVLKYKHRSRRRVLRCLPYLYFNSIKPKHRKRALDTGRLVQLLSTRYRCGRCGVRFPGRSNRTQCCQRLGTVATFLRSCVVQALSHGDGPHHSRFGAIWREQ